MLWLGGGGREEDGNEVRRGRRRVWIAPSMCRIPDVVMLVVTLGGWVCKAVVDGVAVATDSALRRLHVENARCDVDREISNQGGAQVRDFRAGHCSGGGKVSLLLRIFSLSREPVDSVGGGEGPQLEGLRGRQIDCRFALQAMLGCAKRTGARTPNITLSLATNPTTTTQPPRATAQPAKLKLQPPS